MSAPPPGALLFVFTILGSALSFGVGRDPQASLPEDLVAEVAPSLAVICLFLVSYSVFDVLASGVAKREYVKKDYKDWPSRLPEQVFVADRAQANQLEQMPGFLVSTLCFSILVNGKVGAALGFLWVILRRLYASKYRASAGIKFFDKGLGTFTIPCYFIIDSMLMGSVIQVLRMSLAK